MRVCEQCKQSDATVYAIDRLPGGWGGYYCEPCSQKLNFQIVDRLGAATPREQIAERKNKLLAEGIIELWNGEVILSELGEHAVYAGTGHVRNEVAELFPSLIR